MIDYSLIKAAFLPKIGWRQNPDPNGTKLIDLTTSTSSLYYNEAHALLKFGNLESLCFDDSNISYPVYDNGVEYSFGDIVSESSVNYIYINQTASTGNTPPDTTFWRKYEVLTETLRRETEAGIEKAVSDWFKKKSKLRTAGNVIANEFMIKTTGDMTDINANDEKVRFIEITPRQSLNMVMKPYKIGLQFTSTGDIPIKVFRSDQSTPILEQTFEITAANSVNWFDIDLTLQSGYRYWISYDESDISGNTSINGMRDKGYLRDFINMPLGRYYDAVGGYVNGSNDTLWDLDNNKYNTVNNYGVNLKVTVRCDYTQFIIDQADEFLEAVRLSVAMYVLRKFALNPEARVNRRENKINVEQILYEIDGDSRGTVSSNRALMVQYQEALDAIMFDMGAIDKVCLPCSKKRPRITHQ